MNFKTILGSLGVCALVGGWMVTASVAESNRDANERQDEELKSVTEYVAEQRTMNTSQFAINENLVLLIKKQLGDTDEREPS